MTIHWYRQLILSVFVGLFGVIINLTPWGLLLEEKFGLFWLFNVRGEITASQDVVVISIDQPSATHLDLPITPSSWPRRLHGDLIENLTAAGARVITFDLVFDKPSDDVENDEIFARAIQKSRNVVLAERLGFEETEMLMDDANEIQYLISKEGPTQLLPMIADAAMAHSPFPLPKVSRVNSYWAFKPGAGDVPTMAASALQIFAIPIYDDFISLLNDVNPTYAATLPVNIETTDIEDLILTLRSLFVHDPQLKLQMQDALGRDSILNPFDKRLIVSLLNLYSGDSTRYLNFYGPPRTVRTIPYYQVLQLSNMDPSEWPDLKDKAVFVGFSAMTQPAQDKVRDDYNTVFSNIDGLYISGVEIVATAFANLLDNRPIRPLPVEGNLGILFVLGFVMGITFLFLPNRKAIVLGGVLIALYIFSVYYQFKEAGIWLPLIVPIFLQMPLALFGSITLKYINAKSEHQRIVHEVEYYLPERVIDNIVKRTGSRISNDQSVYGICMATDVDMYTTLSESMSPVKLRELLKEYYFVLFVLIEKHNGTVLDIAGDGMLAIWAAPLANTDLHQQACLASLDLTNAIKEFNQNSNNPPLHTRIGLNFGEISLGKIGSKHRQIFHAVGDTVNTANRIQSLNKDLKTRLLISADVVEGLDGFLVRPLGDFIFKNKNHAVSLAELITHKHAATSEQLWLCKTFATALHAYQSQKFDEARAGFQEILKTHHKDGPAKFFLDHCQKVQQKPLTDTWQHAIRIDDN